MYPIVKKTAIRTATMKNTLSSCLLPSTNSNSPSSFFAIRNYYFLLWSGPGTARSGNVRPARDRARRRVQGPSDGGNQIQREGEHDGCVLLRSDLDEGL